MLMATFYVGTVGNARRPVETGWVRSKAKVEIEENDLALITLSFDNPQSRD
jgi:hypothetical protein